MTLQLIAYIMGLILQVILTYEAWPNPKRMALPGATALPFAGLSATELIGGYN